MLPIQGELGLEESAVCKSEESGVVSGGWRDLQSVNCP